MNIGELAALGTAICWSFGSVFFTIASKNIGPTIVNRLRLIIAVVLLGLTQIATSGRLMPVNMSAHHWFWFGISGIIGFAIGDGCLFSAFVVLGPRITMLIMALVPVFSTLFAWVLMGETLNIIKIIAIFITLTGVIMVVINKYSISNGVRSYFKGILLALGASLCQALGLLLSKKGLSDGFAVIPGNIIRLSSAILVVWSFAALRSKIMISLKQLGKNKATLSLIGGAIFGPFLGVSLSLVAINHSFIGIASTIMALPPIFLIPLSSLIFKEKITLTAIIGAVIAVTGTAIIFMAK